MGHWTRLLRCSSELGLDEAMPAPPKDGPDSGGLVELATQHQRLTVETSSDGVRLLVGSGVCLELSQLPAPEYLALVAHTYEAVGSC